MRLPPLNALRAFESAGRTLSFTRAADELSVTQSAVSHQIKTLEEHLGLALFRRGTRRLALTEAGQNFLPEVSGAFERLRVATDRLARRDDARLVVSTAPSFAHWLVPQLGGFRKRHPEIDLAISATDRMIDYLRGDADCGVRYGDGRWPGLHVERFLMENFYPVCAPGLLESGPPLRTPADLRHYTLLHDEMREDWRMWFLAAGVSGFDPTRGPSFSHSSMVIQAAIAGTGVALGRSSFVAADLAAGRLVKPFDIALKGDWAFYFVCAPDMLARPKVAAFRSWLFDLAAETRDKKKN